MSITIFDKISCARNKLLPRLVIQHWKRTDSVGRDPLPVDEVLQSLIHAAIEDKMHTISFPIVRSRMWDSLMIELPHKPRRKMHVSSIETENSLRIRDQRYVKPLPHLSNPRLIVVLVHPRTRRDPRETCNSYVKLSLMKHLLNRRELRQKRGRNGSTTVDPKLLCASR
jgi:hypothetical protein